MRHRKLSSADEENPGLDISSLIDVCFLLLIYFIVATTIVQERKLDMNIPGPPPPSDKPPELEPGMVTVDAAGVVYWGSGDARLEIDRDLANHELPQLVDQLKTLKMTAEQKEGATAVVMLVIEGEVPHQRVVDVINALTIAEIKNVAMVEMKDD